MTNYRPNSDKMFADITDGIAIIINSETGIYYGMNAFGTQVYENLANGISDNIILEKIMFLGGNEQNFRVFLDSLIKTEILILGSPSEYEINIDENVAKEDNYILEVREYNDAQELLLADPIHDVKEEEGWSPDKSSLNEDKEDVARREAKMET